MAITPQLMTWQELADLPDDGMRYELVRGVLLTMAAPFYEHGKSADKIGRSLENYVEAEQLGEVRRAEIGCLLTTSPDTVRAPDLAFLSREHLASVGDVRGYFPGSPDLVVEVVSTNDRLTRVAAKVAEWLEHGAKLVFVVNPGRKTVDVHQPGQPARTLGIDDVLEGEDVVPGWSMPIGDLFDQP